MPEQLSFDLPGRTARAREDFFVAPSNALAVAMIDLSDSWPSGKMVLTGEAGAGKTHLAHVWADRTGARILSARDLRPDDVPDLATGPLVVEDVPLIARDDPAQQALFHLHNLTLAHGHRLLMTGRGPARHWNLSLPDLQSRVEGAQSAALEAPCDRLLSALLAKLFADRQITPHPAVIPYVVNRMDRSFAAAQKLVDDLDRASLAQGRSVTRDLAARYLGGDPGKA
ncbi:MAG: chromosomal replication initiator DnaA [Rhodobacteraceae bacterium]|nr:MAG: chromosomal replication initiator DnaA [Paracoccaceae bacterium]